MGPDLVGLGKRRRTRRTIRFSFFSRRANRHAGVVLAAQTDTTLAELMGRLGQSTPGAAMRYQQDAADRDAETARRWSELAGE